MKKIRICVCDNHALFREGVKAVLRAEPSIEIAGEAADGKDALELIGRVEPDIALVGISLPVLRGYDVAERVSRDHEKTRVIILTVYDDEDMVARCLDAGAAGYVLKDTSPGQLLYAITWMGASVPQPEVRSTPDIEVLSAKWKMVVRPGLV